MLRSSKPDLSAMGH